MITCTQYTPINKGVCLGIATIYIPKWGIEIHGCALNEKDGARWISLPSRPYEVDGKKKYASHITFKEDTVYKKFMEIAKEAVESKRKELEDVTQKQPLIFDEEVPF